MVNFASAFLTRTFVNILILMFASHSLGVAIAFPSPATSYLRDSLSFSEVEISFFCAVTSLTAVFGPFVTNPLLKLKGHRFTVQVVGVLFALSWLFFLGSDPSHKSFAHIHRALIGLACGGVSAVVPMYIIELSPFELHSIYGTMHQFGVSFGIFATNFLSIWLTATRLAHVSLLFAVGLIIALRVVPESPSFYLSNGAGRQDSKAPDRLCGSRYFRYVVIGVLMMFFQQVSGVNAVLTNLGVILTNRAGPALAASAQCFSVVCCISVIDRIGRVNTWAVSLFGSAASMALLAVGLRWEWKGLMNTISAFGFLFFFCFGLGPIPWFLPPELFPDRVRPAATSILSSLNWILSFAVVFLYPVFVEQFGVFAVLMFFAAVLVAGGFFGFGALKQRKEQVGAEALLHQAERMVPGYLQSEGRL
jgi:MFS family permease